MVDAEEPVRDSDEPIQQRGFFQVAHAVDVQRHPVVALQHLFGGLCVGGISIVEQRGLKAGAEVNCSTEREQADQGQALAQQAALAYQGHTHRFLTHLYDLAITDNLQKLPTPLDPLAN